MKLLIIKTIVIMVSFGSTIGAQNNSYKEIQLTNTTSDNRYASYNKEGKLIIFESNRNGNWQIYSMDVNGNNQRRVISSEFNDRRPTWHPYKNIILFESDRSGYNDLYTYDFDTRTLKKLPIPLKGNKSFASFNPNGTELIFNYKVSDNNFNINVVSTNGKRLKTVINNAFANLYPRFTPRGDAFTYFSKKKTKNVNNEIFVYNIILKKEARLTTSTENNYHSSWSNNGQRIIYATAFEDEKSDIYVMNKNGKSKRPITINGQGNILPNWSPNDINLLITGKRNGYYQICKILLKEKIIIDKEN